MRDLKDQRTAKVESDLRVFLVGSCGAHISHAELLLYVLTINCFDEPKSASLTLSSESSKMSVPGVDSSYHIVLAPNLQGLAHTPLMSLCSILRLWR